MDIDHFTCTCILLSCFSFFYIQILSFVFLTDRENITLSRFNGSFSFIPDTSYKLGAVDTSHGRDAICNFLIDSSSPSSNMYGGGSFGGRRGSKEGRIMTPTYPGTYPKNLKCSYKFIGMETQIIIFSFHKIVLDYSVSEISHQSIFVIRNIIYNFHRKEE